MKENGAWKFFVAIGIILLLMVGFYWYHGFKLNNEQMENKYNGFDFFQQGNFWITQLTVAGQPYNMKFYHHPRDTLTVWKNPTATEPIFAGPEHIWISVDPDAGPKVVIAAVEIARITGQRFDLLNIPTSSALSRKQEGLDTPVVTCDQSSPEHVVIQFVQDEENAIVRDENCIILFYKTPDESIRVADRFAYMLLKIMY